MRLFPGYPSTATRKFDPPTKKEDSTERRAKLAEKLKIIFSYGSDLLRGKQIIIPDRLKAVGVSSFM